MEEKIISIVNEIDAAIKDGILEKDPDNENNILIYYCKNDSAGWYSENILSVAGELARDEEQYQEFKIAIENAKDVLNEMIFTLVMDREIDKNKHYISPGGYEISNGKRFDFLTSEGNVNVANKREIEFRVYDFDDDFAKESNESFSNPFVSSKDINSFVFREFFVFTGESDEPEINVVEIKDLLFRVCRNGESMKITATKEQIESINKYFKEKCRERV